MKTMQELMVDSMKLQLEKITIDFDNTGGGIINARLCDASNETKSPVIHNITINMGKPYTFYEIFKSFLALDKNERTV